MRATQKHNKNRKSRFRIAIGKKHQLFLSFKIKYTITSMIEHIVLFKWQENASAEAIAKAMAALRDLKEKIPSIVDLSCGENFSDRARGYTHGLVVRFRDRAGLEAYQPHPLHQDVVQNFIKPIIAEVLALDYEF